MQRATRLQGIQRSASHIMMLTACAGQIESNYDETTDSFDSMNLKAELLRGTLECIDQDPQMLTSQRRLCIRFRTPLCYSAARHHAGHCWYDVASPVDSEELHFNIDNRSRCYRTGSIWHWKDRYICHLLPPEYRHQAQGLPGTHPCPYPRTGTTDSKGCGCHR